MRNHLRLSAAVFAAAVAALVFAAVASADPTGSKRSFSGMAVCTNGVTAPFVVNSANGQGSGSQDNNTAEWTPAHILGSNLVFHPTVFNLTFTFTPNGGTPQSFTQIDTRANAPAPVTCTISGTQTDPAGDTFSLSGQVSGWFS